jgi:hypothetical protein
MRKHTRENIVNHVASFSENKERVMKWIKALLTSSVGIGLAVAVFVSTPARASIIFSDDFNGIAGPTNSTLWNQSPPGFAPATLDGSGNARLASAQALESANFYAPTASGDLRLTFNVAQASSTDIIGFNDLVNTRISLRFGTTWTMHISDGVSNKTFDTGLSHTALGAYIITWAPARVTFAYDDGTGPVTKFDSSLNAPAQGGPWLFPSTSLPALALVLSGGTDQKIASATLEQLPEPASLGLLSVGAIALLSRRQRGQ